MLKYCIYLSEAKKAILGMFYLLGRCVLSAMKLSLIRKKINLFLLQNVDIVIMWLKKTNRTWLIDIKNVSSKKGLDLDLIFMYVCIDRVRLNHQTLKTL